MAEQIYTVLMTIVAYLLDPVKLITLGMSLFGDLLSALAYVLPDPASKYIGGVGSFFTSGPIAHLEDVCMFFLSPIVHPTLFAWCLSTVFLRWLVPLIVQFAMTLKGWVYGGGAT